MIIVQTSSIATFSSFSLFLTCFAANMISSKSPFVNFENEMLSHSLRLTQTQTSPKKCLSMSMSAEVNDFHSDGIFRRLLLTVSQMLPKQALRTVSGTDDWFAK